MASLAQARLVRLTQRYLAMSAWRPDFRECLITNTAVMADARTRSSSSSSSSLPVSITSEVLDASIRRHDSRLVKVRNFRIRDYHGIRELLREMNTPEYIGCNHMRLEALVRTQPSTIMMFNDILIRKYYREKLTLRNILATIWSKTSPGNNRDNSHDYHNGWSDSKNRRFLPFCVLFGMMGLFRKPSANELDEERARLTDEQKVRKMKPVELAIAKGVLSMCDQNYEIASKLFHDALHMAQDERDNEREELILNLIASNYFESGDFQNAEKLFIDLMKRMIARDTATTAPEILELSLKLASIYSKKPDTAEKALKGFKFVISSLLNDLDDIVSNLEEVDLKNISNEKRNELALLGWSYDWFAKHLLSMNDYESAASMLHKAYEISNKILGPLHDQTLILLNDIGTTLAMNQSPEEGRRFIEKAVEGAITNHSSELASFYVNLGLVYLGLRDLKEAKQYCEYSLDIAKKNPEHYNSHDVVELSQTCLTQINRLLGTER